MKILAIGAHPDDIEIFMLGLLLICLQRGDEISLIVATDGSAGSVSINKGLSQIRKNETIRALQDVGLPDMLGFPDGMLTSSKDAHDVINKKIKILKPDLIITHAPEDYHPDHRILSHYVTQSAGFKSPVIFCDTLMGVNFNPNFYIDISKVFQKKANAIMFHKSQAPEKFLEATTLMNRFRSAQCNSPKNNFAEAYRYDASFPFADIRGLLPCSPKINHFYKNKETSFI